ncbi:MAG: PEP/pyruvate-binding domain-containing protein [Candidatus Gracilibacteria bacterium]|jgi:phosphohistidine swiveling domain-containing protein
MNNIGSKTVRLEELKRLGLNVPKFRFLTTDDVVSFDHLKADRIHEELKCDKYAVRSSALIEDCANQSFAGQFKTKLDVLPDKLTDAIKEVIAHANDFLNGDLNKFSIIIQEYIDPNFSGVTFTRNPLGGREMVVEYHEGVGEDLVSGKIKPKKTNLFWTDSVKCELPSFNEAVENFKKIENFYKFPQDIEWCVKNGKWYFLQTRPITTVDKNEYESYKYLDSVLPVGRRFYFEKTEISEIAPRPTQVTRDLLDLIYAKSGPVEKVYRKYGIEYEARNIIKIIGNELFVDREEEIKTLLPSYSFLSGLYPKPKLSSLSGVFMTFKNYFKLNRISLRGFDEIKARLKIALEDCVVVSGMSEFLKKFFSDYEVVFEINLLAGVAFSKLEAVLGKDCGMISGILGSDGLVDTGVDFDFKVDCMGWKGNSLDVSDESDFMAKKHSESVSAGVKKWWDGMSEIRKKLLHDPIKYALIYGRLREFSRWLVVKDINTLREFLPDGNYFVRLDEIVSGHVSKKECEKRRDEYLKFSSFSFSKILFWNPVSIEEELKVVSSGDAEGVLVTEKELDSGAYPGKKILYTKNLGPELTKYFDLIDGILSDRGSLLSHLAIVARENKLPVIVNFTLSKSGLRIGDKIRMKNGLVSVD